LRISSVAIIFGAVLALFGSVFAAQGFGFLGPPTSSMFRNTVWIEYGAIIASAGVLLMIVALLVRYR
jgi:hypothetical protein